MTASQRMFEIYECRKEYINWKIGIRLMVPKWYTKFCVLINVIYIKQLMNSNKQLLLSVFVFCIFFVAMKNV